MSWYAGFVVCFGVLFPILTVYAIDPLQFFRRAAYDPIFSTNERYQIPGLARNYDYDTVITGTSMAQNFHLDYADKILGARTLKVAISGSTAHEQFLALNIAIRTGKVKRVIWGIDRWVFRGPPDRVRDDLGAFPHYLYSENSPGKIWYLTNASYLWESLQILLDWKRLSSRSSGRIPEDWDTVDKFYHYGRSAIIKDYFNPLNRSGLASADIVEATELQTMEKNFDANLMRLVYENPAIEFVIYFPPYSILHAKLYQIYSPAMFERLLDFQSFVTSKLVGLSNVRVFDFSDVSEITHNLDLYMDLGHFNVRVNEYMVRAFVSGENRVTRDDPLASVGRLRRQVEAYREPARLQQGTEIR